MGTPRRVNYHVEFGAGFSGINSPGAQVWWVGETAAVGGAAASDDNDGMSPQQAYATIQKGLDSAVAARGDVVAVLPGSYTITAPLTMTKSDVTLTGARVSGPQTRNPSVIICATDSIEMISVDAANVTVENLTLDHNTTTANIDLIDVGDATASPDCILRNLFFDMEGSATNTDGVNISTDTVSPRVLIEGCTFHDYDQDGIVIGAANDEAVIRNCRFYDEVTANVGQYAISTVSDGSLIEGCVIRTAGTAGVYANVALLLQTVNCNIWATAANTICILMAASATTSSSGCWLTAVAAGNLCDYTTDKTTPSADANISGIFAATPGASGFDDVTVGGS